MYTEQTEKKFNQFRKSLQAYVGNDLAETLIEQLGEENIKSASFATTTDTGMAYEGSFLNAVLDITSYAIKINGLLPEDKQVDRNSIVKIGLLSHLSKVKTLIPNPNTWEVEKRGMAYTFAKNEGALRTGERSLLICYNAGITFSEIEFEAMRIIDKINEEDNYSKYFSSTLSMLIKQANEIIGQINRNK